MSSPQITRTSTHKADERNFTLSGHTLWVCRLIGQPGGERLGIKLKVIFPLSTTTSSYFTKDGNQFFQVSNSIDPSAVGVEISVGAAEVNPETLSTLKGAFSIWNRASGHSERRDAIRECCVRFTNLLGSLQQTSVLSHFQDAKSLQQESQTVPDDKVQLVEEGLAALEQRLLNSDAEDSNKILSPERHKKFMLIGLAHSSAG